MNGIGLFGIITVCSTLAVFIVCIALYCRIQTKRHFKCPRCGARFSRERTACSPVRSAG